MPTVLIFPGQGSQTQGMGKVLFDAYPEVREIFTEGSDVTGVDLKKLCFETEDSVLSRTENAQLAIFTVSMSIIKLLVKIRPVAVAGFSLGECSALCAAGAYSIQDGFRIVKKRAELMQAACDKGGGAMSAVLGLDGADVAQVAKGLDAEPVNFNCPGQVVIAGTVEGVAALEQKCLQAGARRVLRLALSGAFHTKAMSGAAEEFSEFLKNIKFYPPTIPVYTNITGDVLPKDANMPEHFAFQMCNPVQWQTSVNKMLEKNVDRFIEVGHGQTLSQFVKRISKTAEVFGTDTEEKLDLIGV